MHDAAGRCVQIAENGSTPSYSGNAIKNFIWCGSERCEQRDYSNAVVSQYSGFGQRNSSTNYYYAFDHLGSVREVTSDGGTVQGAFGFDPYGNMTVLVGSFKPDFGFTGIYQHSRTNLALTLFRQYNPALGRWLSRDPLGEAEGLNLYGYAGKNPISYVDTLGLDVWTMYDPRGVGHVGNLVGNPSTGYLYLSKTSKPSDFRFYKTLREFRADRQVDVNLRRYKSGVYIPRSRSQDAAMALWGAAHLQDYDVLRSNCVDFSVGLLKAGDLPDFGRKPGTGEPAVSAPVDFILDVKEWAVSDEGKRLRALPIDPSTSLGPIEEAENK